MRFGLIVEYDGTNFHGSQLQSNARTVQGEIESALLQIFSEKIRLHFASRTDSGVHARGQVGRFDAETGAELERRGHKVEWLSLYGGRADNVCGIAANHESGTLAAGADLRGEAYAIAR